MNYRKATLQSTISITTAQTETIEINLSDVISRISVVLELVNNGNNPTNHPLAAIKKIQIIDGSKVIASMTGYAAQALAFNDGGKTPHNELNYEDNGYARCFIPMDFGRYLYDPDLGLDPKKYKNLQLNIEHDYSLGGCSPDGAYLRVVADVFDQKVAHPVGYLQAKEISAHTPSGAAGKVINLPLDNDIRMIMIMNVNDNEEPDIQFEDVLVDEEDGKRVILDVKCMDLIRDVALRHGRFSEYLSGHLATTTDDEFWLTACKDIQVGGLCDLNDAVLTFTWSGGRSRVFYASAATYFGCIVSGLCPHGSVPVYLGNQQDPSDWWNVQNVGKARLKLTPRLAAGALSADTEKTTDVIVQSFQKYLV